MDSINEDIVGLLQYLLPGFLAAWVFYGLTAHQKPSQFERVIQALIFTLIVQAIVSLEKWVAEESESILKLGYGQTTRNS
ncbi:hypothetical protein [Pelagibius sp.]|uniref:hypothetical protein n=1 Tax=Pelagibius sp. TaxID=1931238 RepID=UPI003C7DE737